MPTEKDSTPNATFQMQLTEADKIAQKALKRDNVSHDENRTCAIVGIDGRSRLIKRFRTVSTKIRQKEFQHPELPLTYEHIRGEGTRLYHDKIDEEDNPLAQYNAYTELLDYLQKRGYAEDGEV